MHTNMVKKAAACAAGALVLASVLVPAGSAAADRGDRPAPTAGPAATLRGFGWVWADQEVAGGVYYPSASYQYSSGLAGTVNYSYRYATGKYRVTIRNVNGDGTPHVTAYGGTTNRCKVQSWVPYAGRDTDVLVNCFTRTGAPVDSKFSLSFANLRPTTYKYGRIWYDGSSTPSAYRYNSKGGTNTVARTGTGAYTAKLPKLGGAIAGQVQVTAVGTTSTWCKVHSFGTTNATQEVKVRCFNPSGTAVNGGFVLTYTQGGNLLGAPNVSGGQGLKHAYAMVKPGSAPNAVNAFRYSSPAGTNFSVANLGPGYHQLTVPVNMDAGTVQVTTVGTSAHSCSVEAWFGNSVYVRCSNSSGVPSGSDFEVTAISKHLVLV